MAPCKTVPTRGRRLGWALPLLPALALMLGACKEEKTAAEAAPRPVRTITAGKGDIGETVVLTGQILLGVMRMRWLTTRLSGTVCAHAACFVARRARWIRR